MPRALALLAVPVLAASLAACSQDPNSISAQAKEGSRKGYISGDGAVEAIPVASRGKPVADIEQDVHWRARELLVDVPNGHRSIRMHNVVPRMSGTPGEICDAGGALGEDNDAVYGDELGLSGDERERLRSAGII